MLAARSLGLGVEIKPIIKNPTYRYEASPKSKYVVGDQFRVVSGEYGDVFQDKGFDDASCIFWCQKFKYWLPAFAAVLHNEARICYQAPAILVTVPAWSERHHTILH